MTIEEKDRLLEDLTFMFCGIAAGFIIGWSVHKDYFSHKDEAKTTVDTTKAAKPIAKDSATIGWIRVPVVVLKGSAQNHSGEEHTEEARAMRKHTERADDSSSLGMDGNVPNSTHLDTAWVTLPRSQKRYQDSTYEAWVSGYDAKLDSIYVYRKTVRVVEKQTVVKKRPFSLGIIGGAGYGVFSKKPEVFLGIGGSIRIW